MKRTAFIVVAVLLLGPLTTMAPAELGHFSGLGVFVTWPDEDYDMGSSVNVTVRVYLAGDPFDPDIVNLTVTGYGINRVNLTRTETGTYIGTFVITEDNVQYSTVWFKARAGFQTGPWFDDASDYGSIDIRSDRYQMSLTMPDPSDTYSLPGQTIELEMVTAYKGEVVDAMSPVELIAFDTITYAEVPVAMSRVALGHYEGSFTIPSNWTRSVTYEFEAYAAYSNGTGTFSAYGYQITNVVLFDIWRHDVDIDYDRAVIEYYVLDRDLLPVGGADVALNYSYDNDDGDARGDDASAVTDELGKVRFDLYYPQISEYQSHIGCNVTVESGGFTQFIKDGVLVNELGPWKGYGLHVKPTGNGMLKADTDVTLEMEATMDGRPYVDQAVTVYIASDVDVYYSENVTTDEDGVLTVQFHTPVLPTGFDPYIELGMDFTTADGPFWRSDHSWWMVTEHGDISSILDLLDPGTSLSVPTLTRGEPIEVVLECNDADGDEMAHAMWGMGPMDDWVYWNEMTAEEWTAITVMESATFRDLDLAWSDGAFRGTIVIPYFLPDDIRITIVGMVALSEGPDLDTRVAVLEDVSTMPPNHPPTVRLLTGVDGYRFSDTMVVSGKADDDNGVESVEYRIDGGPWVELTGTDWWIFELDTKTLPSGTHQLEVRSFDGEKHSDPIDAAFVVDQIPSIEITGNHKDGRTYRDKVQLTGVVIDDLGVDLVVVQLDDGDWIEADLEGSVWTFDVPTSGLQEGEHTLKVRADDGSQYSEEVSTTFRFEKSEEPGFGAIIALIALTVVLLVALSRRVR